MSEKTNGFAPLNDDELAVCRVSVWPKHQVRNIARVLSSRREQNLAIHRLLLDAFYDAFLVNPADKVYIAPRMTAFLETMTKLHDENALAIVQWLKKFSIVSYSKKERRFNINQQETGKLSLYSIPDESQRANAFWKWAIATGLCCVQNHDELYKIIREGASPNKIEKCDTCHRRITFRLDVGRNRRKAFDVDKKNIILGPHICNGHSDQSLHTVRGGAVNPR